MGGYIVVMILGLFCGIFTFRTANKYRTIMPTHEANRIAFLENLGLFIMLFFGLFAKKLVEYWYPQGIWSILAMAASLVIFGMPLKRKFETWVGLNPVQDLEN
jgi:uncharacterized membrane protein YiaA